MPSELGTWLRQQRQARSWPVREMARQLRDAAISAGDNTVPGIDTLARNIRRWEAGHSGISERYALHYCKALGIEPGRFGPNPPPQPRQEAGSFASHSAAFAVGIPAAAGLRPGPNLPAWPAGPGRYRDDERQHDAAEPWELPGRAGIPREQVIAAIAEQSQDFGEWADTSNIGDSTLEHYAGQVRRLARDYVYAPPFPLLLDAKRLRDRVFAKLQGHQRPDHTRDLYLIAAQVCGLLAWMSGDLNFYGAADTHAWTAWVCAEQAGHDGARAWVRATQSKLAYWDARYADSAQLAEDGLGYGYAGSAGCMLALFQARALTRLGRGRDGAAALAAAQAALDRAGPDEIGGLWSVDAARYHSLAGNVHMLGGEADQVLAEGRQALTLFEAADARERNYGAQAHTRIDQAQAHLRRDDLDGADAALRLVFALSPEARYEPITQHLGHIQQALARPAFRDAPKARELQEEIETYRRESIVNGLRG